MDIHRLTADLVNMDQGARDLMLMELAKGLARAGLLQPSGDSSLGGAAEVMSYLTRQPVPLRGLRLLGVHAVECVQIMHPTKKILLEIPKAEYDEEKHGPIVKSRKAAAATVVAPPEEEEEDEDEDEEGASGDTDDAEDEDEDEDDDDKTDKTLKPRGRGKRSGRK